MVETLQKPNLVNKFPLVVMESRIIHISLTLAHALTFAVKSIYSDALMSESTEEVSHIEAEVSIVMNEY